jgi:hypothetical protein
MKKRCSRCKEPRELEEFSICKRAKDGRNYRCLQCTRELGGAFRTKNPELSRRIIAASRLKLKIEVFSHYCGGAPRCMCSGCNETLIEFLTIDHVNGDGASQRKALGWRGKADALQAWLREQDYPDGFQVLCFNCNCGKGKKGVCPHLSTSLKAQLPART